MDYLFQNLGPPSANLPNEHDNTFDQVSDGMGLLKPIDCRFTFYNHCTSSIHLQLPVFGLRLVASFRYGDQASSSAKVRLTEVGLDWIMRICQSGCVPRWGMCALAEVASAPVNVLEVKWFLPQWIGFLPERVHPNGIGSAGARTINAFIFMYLSLLKIKLQNITTINPIYSVTLWSALVVSSNFTPHLTRSLAKELFKPMIYGKKVSSMCANIESVCKNEKKKLLFRIRDSYLLLPAALNNLAQDLCLKFGSKGTIPYEKLRLEYLPEKLIEGWSYYDK
ncbi:hypothetical protein RND71_003589 [Anisodus tanguticus]|uniref:DNA-directed DNA polymerase n=1 Tax=Anisodus tanguticus TaxID=243964 RepID=A0AAE1STI7_9SOLA|nr:hypothetical protein RND71_003589 [Anisodus tanguticus]